MALLRAKANNLSPLLNSSLSHLLRRQVPLAATPLLHRHFRAGRSDDADLSLSRYSHKTGTNWGIRIVPQQQAYVIERFGKFLKVLGGGIHFLIPFVDRVAYVHSLKEESFKISGQSAFTLDNVSLQVDGLLYVRIVNPQYASYGVENPILMVKQLAQTTVRSELGKLELDTILKERDKLNLKIVSSINEAAEGWGVKCVRYEIQDISPPPGVKQAMEMQVGAERKKRAQILEAEGEKESQIKVAEGKKQAVVLAAEGDAKAILARAQATSEGLKRVSEAMLSSGGAEAASLSIAEQYIKAFAGIAKEGTTVLLPGGSENPYSMMAQAMSLFKTLNATDKLSSGNSRPKISSTDYKTEDTELLEIPDSNSMSNSEGNIEKFSLRSPNK